MADRRSLPTSAVLAAPAPGVPGARLMDRMRPVYTPDAPDCPVGLVYLHGAASAESETYFAVTFQGVRCLVAGRRVNRADDPRAVYILSDGSVWVGESDTAVVVAALAHADDRS